jgi:hypothetical protein
MWEFVEVCAVAIPLGLLAGAAVFVVGYIINRIMDL